MLKNEIRTLLIVCATFFLPFAKLFSDLHFSLIFLNDSDNFPMTSLAENFSDIVPVPQDDGPRPVVLINYDPTFRATMDIFRAVLKSDELSARALTLTADVIDLNAANYTAWHFRRRCLQAIGSDGSDYRAELEYVSAIAGDNPKNYQIWYHRRVIAEQLEGSSEGELAYTAGVLAEDSKNYHAWSHRQWVVRHCGCWEEEMLFVESMLKEDVRNNSAWNQRWFVVHGRRLAGGGGGGGGGGGSSGGDEDDSSRASQEEVVRVGLNADLVRAELEFAFCATSQAPKNQSPWSYIEGLMRGREYVDFPQIRDHLTSLEEGGVQDSPPMCACWINVLESSGTSEDATRARAICQDLETRLDTVRAKYWVYRQANVKG